MIRLGIHSLLLLGCFLTLNLCAQDYQHAQIWVDADQWSVLSKLGLALDHVERGADFVRGDFSRHELDLARDHHFEVDVLFQDAESHYRRNSENLQRALPSCSNLDFDHIETPVNFQKGSMLGHPTFEEMLEHLDQMAARYPDLITARQPVADFVTFEGRPIYHVKISDNANVDEDEPKILYTALHHAREPVSLTQMIYYMWYVLENYETDPRLREIVDGTEMHFIPCLNPDGYIYNETTNPEGGGLWRKNRRELGEGNFGVDLNRNYGFKWGLDNFGSSPDPRSEIYRGPEPFSEPEIRAVQYLAEQHEFKIALNYHSFGNFLIYPLGYTNEPAADLTTFQNLGDLLTRENRFVHGSGYETVSYLTNGDADDWFYSNEDKITTWSFTPEVGNGQQGFWPPESAVEGLCKRSLEQNIIAAFFLLNSGDIVDEASLFLTDLQGELPFRLTKFGFEEVGLQLNFTPLTDNIAVEFPSKFFILDLFSTEHDAFTYTLPSDISYGERIAFVYTIDNGTYAHSDTIVKYYHRPQILVDNTGTFPGWKTSNSRPEGIPVEGWDETTSLFYSAPSSLTDSPRGNYLPLTTNELNYDGSINLAGSDSAVISFQARWDIQQTFDHMTFEVAGDDGIFTPQCGLYTQPGEPNFPGIPRYTGRQLSWVHEHIDLSAYVGQRIHIRFVMKSHAPNDSRDGIYIDDIRLLQYNEGVILGNNLLAAEQFESTLFPNPTREYLNVDSKVSSATLKPERVEIMNGLGQHVTDLPWEAQLTISVGDWAPGVYYYQIVTTDGRRSKAQRFVVF